ncbi:MAG: carboxy-S-adenosyl-L-methionine synthase CmoA [Pirellulaceae bacterium]
MSDSHDDLYSKPLPAVGSFEFNQDVVRVFEDMISRSVPHYRSTLEMMIRMAQQAYQPGTKVFDLGCSLGGFLLPLAESLKDEITDTDDSPLIGVDNSSAMLAELAKRAHGLPITLWCESIQDVAIENASVVILNYTLQFVPVSQRASLLAEIADGLVKDGILLMSEKISGVSDAINDLFIQQHHDFKRRQGYSELEIAQKRQSLEDVLVTETVPQHLERLFDAGFSECCVWHQCFNFVSFYAKK